MVRNKLGLKTRLFSLFLHPFCNSGGAAGAGFLLPRGNIANPVSNFPLETATTAGRSVGRGRTALLSTEHSPSRAFSKDSRQFQDTPGAVHAAEPAAPSPTLLPGSRAGGSSVPGKCSISLWQAGREAKAQPRLCADPTADRGGFSWAPSPPAAVSCSGDAVGGQRRWMGSRVTAVST